MIGFTKNDSGAPSRRRATRTAVIVATFAVAAAAAGPALADSTIGQTGAANLYCPANVITGQSSYVVPAGGGTITSFSFSNDPSNAGESIEFLVLRPVGGTSYTVVGSTSLITLPATAGTLTFPANIPARAGDILGFYTGTLVNSCILVGGSSSFSFSNFPSPQPATGDTVDLPATFSNATLNESAHLSTQGTTVVCSSTTVRVGQPVTCKATVTGGVHPTGTITFASNSSGTFSSKTCTLVQIGGNQAACTVTYTPTLVGTGSHKIYANYSGDAANAPSHGSTTITVTN